jgi:hypothetical protein
MVSLGFPPTGILGVPSSLGILGSLVILVILSAWHSAFSAFSFFGVLISFYNLT